MQGTLLLTKTSNRFRLSANESDQSSLEKKTITWLLVWLSAIYRGKITRCSTACSGWINAAMRCYRCLCTSNFCFTPILWACARGEFWFGKTFYISTKLLSTIKIYVIKSTLTQCLSKVWKRWSFSMSQGQPTTCPELTRKCSQTCSKHTLSTTKRLSTAKEWTL